MSRKLVLLVEEAPEGTAYIIDHVHGSRKICRQFSGSSTCTRPVCPAESMCCNTTPGLRPLASCKKYEWPLMGSYAVLTSSQSPAMTLQLTLSMRSGPVCPCRRDATLGGGGAAGRARGAGAAGAGGATAGRGRGEM